jgi:glycosyltransferase involved in cell wall biosynthesis
MLVSVILPVFNADSTLHRALDDLIAQIDVDFEIIAVDDGSSDESWSIIDEYAKRDARVRAVRRGHGGIVAALKAGIETARGEIIARMDADDACPAHRLKTQLALLMQRPEIGLASCRVGPLDKKSFAGGWAHYIQWQNALTEPEDIARDIWAECPLAHPTWMMRREVYEKAGGYREMGWPEDYDLILSLHRSGVRFAKVPEILLGWRDSPKRLSRVDPRYDADAFARCKAHHLARGPLAGKKEVCVWGAGRTTRKRAEHLVAEGIDISYYVDIDPRKIGKIIHGRPVILPEQIPRPAPWLMLAYVGSRGAREEIRETAQSLGFLEGKDILICW